MKILLNEMTGTQTSFSHQFLVLNWVSSCLSFFLSASTVATYIFSTYTTIIITLEPCRMKYWVSSISYWDLIKISLLSEYHKNQGERVTSQITLVLGEIQRFSNMCHQGNTIMVYSEPCHH
jgi:hypothetical protein